MPRMSRLKRAHLKQRRTMIDEIRLRDMNRQAHKRANGIHHVVADMLGDDCLENYVRVGDRFIAGDKIYLDRSKASTRFEQAKRRLVALDVCKEGSSRAEVIAKINRIADFAECVFKNGKNSLYLLRDGEFYSFLFRVKGEYYKRSVQYNSRTKAMDKYGQEKITWISFVSETER
jgi:hypothetical protein